MIDKKHTAVLDGAVRIEQETTHSANIIALGLDDQVVQPVWVRHLNVIIEKQQ